MQKTLPCNDTTAMAAIVTLLQKRVEDESILQTNKSMDNFVSVHAAANINSVHKTIFNPRVTSVGGISFCKHLAYTLLGTSKGTSLAKDRETGLAKGFAFISFQERTDAAKACEKMDGYGFKHLILRVEFAKKAAS